MSKKRLDVLVCERGLAESRQKAQALIMAGQIFVGGQKIDKAGFAEMCIRDRTSDISAGQLIDRTGQLLGLPFPAGKALDGLYGQADVCQNYTVKINDLTFSLSGMENKVRELVERGTPPANVARFVVDTVVKAVLRTTDKALEQYPGLPVLCSGGVASNSALRAALRDAVFAPVSYTHLDVYKRQLLVSLPLLKTVLSMVTGLL